MNFGNFGNTNCYRYLTSQILAASRCGNYYGPDLFTSKNQPTFNKYQAQQERLRVKQQQTEQDYLCPSNYSAFIHSINNNVNPESANQAMRLNQQMGLQQLGRTNVPCRTDCDEITDSLWSAAKKSSIYVPDTATTWYECQREQNMGANLSEKCKMFGMTSNEPYQPHQHLQLARPIRDGEQRRMDPKSFKHISPEFLSLLEEHEQVMLAHNPLYGVDTKGETAPFVEVPRERLQGYRRNKSYSTMSATADKRATTKSIRQSRARSRAQSEYGERRGLIQTISDTCFTDSPKSRKYTSSIVRQSKSNERIAGGEDGEFSKKKNFNDTSRIKIRSNIKFHVAASSGGIFQPKEEYELAAVLSAGYTPKDGVSLCGSMLDAEYRRVMAALTTKKVQNKESVINKRRSREERTARTHRKNGDKENSKEKPASKTNNQHTKAAVLNELFGHTTVNKQFDQKRTKDSKELELIWQKRDITRMRDSEIFLQMENMRRYAETETRGIINMKKQLDCEELERLEDIARQRELMQLTYLRAKGGRDVVQKDVVDNNFKNDFSSEVDDLAQIATQMKKLKIKSYRSLNAPRTQLSHNENELDKGPDGEETTDAFDGMEMNTKKCKKNTFEPRDSLEHIGLLKKRKATLRKSHEQRKKLERMRREPQAEAAEKETCVSSGSLHKTISKLSNSAYEKCSTHSSLSARTANPCVMSKEETESKAKTKRSAGVKVPRSKCKHYRNNKNMPQRRRKTSKKHQTNSSVGHTEPCELSAHNSLELLRQRKRSDKRLRVTRNSCVKINDSSSSKAVSKSELLRITLCTTNELPSTSKAAAKSCTAVHESTFPTSDNETRFEPSTSSLEEMLVHIKSQLKQRKNNKYSISGIPADSSRQKRQLQQQGAKKAEKSNKVKSRSASRKRTNKTELPASKKASKTRKRHKRSLTESVRIPLVRNNEFILGQQNGCMETAYATDTRSQYKNSLQNLTPPTSQPPKTGRKRKLYKKSSNVVQESEA